MVNLVENKIIYSGREKLLIVLGVSILFLFSLFLFFILGERSLFLISFLGVAFLYVLISVVIIKDLYQSLIIFSFLPLIYLNNGFHYTFRNQVLLDAPLIFFFLLFILNTLCKPFQVEIKRWSISRIALIFVVYFTFSAIIGLLNGNNKDWVLIEYYQFLYYLFPTILLTLIRHNEAYQKIIRFLFYIFLIIAAQYTAINLFISETRFVTFQSGFLPIFLGIAISGIFYTKRNFSKRIGYVTALIIIITGVFFTLTRSVWIVSIITILMVIYYYFKFDRGYKFKLFFPSIIILVSIFVVTQDTAVNNNEIRTQGVNELDYRTESLANPVQDGSFLMRVELGYYAIMEFLKSPIWGKGLGDYLKYKILSSNNLPQYYLDNSWFYFLWKGGLIGVLIYATLIYVLFKRLITVFINATDNNTKIVSLGILAGMIGIMILSFVSPLLIKYRSNFLIVFIITYTEIEYSKFDRDKIVDK